MAPLKSQLKCIPGFQRNDRRFASLKNWNYSLPEWHPSSPMMMATVEAGCIFLLYILQIKSIWHHLTLLHTKEETEGYSNILCYAFHLKIGAYMDSIISLVSA